MRLRTFAVYIFALALYPSRPFATHTHARALFLLHNYLFLFLCVHVGTNETTRYDGRRLAWVWRRESVGGAVLITVGRVGVCSHPHGRQPDGLIR